MDNGNLLLLYFCFFLSISSFQIELFLWITIEHGFYILEGKDCIYFSLKVLCRLSTKYAALLINFCLNDELDQKSVNGEYCLSLYCRCSVVIQIITTVLTILSRERNIFLHHDSTLILTSYYSGISPTLSYLLENKKRNMNVLNTDSLSLQLWHKYVLVLDRH